MKLLGVKEVVSVKLFEVEVSEDELEVYECCMRFIHQNFAPDKIEEICGAYEDELLGMYEEIESLLETYSDLRPKVK